MSQGERLGHQMPADTACRTKNQDLHRNSRKLWVNREKTG
jgi:hypothetical protein